MQPAPGHHRTGSVTSSDKSGLTQWKKSEAFHISCLHPPFCVCAWAEQYVSMMIFTLRSRVGRLCNFRHFLDVWKTDSVFRTVLFQKRLPDKLKQMNNLNIWGKNAAQMQSCSSKPLISCEDVKTVTSKLMHFSMKFGPKLCLHFQSVHPAKACLHWFI